MRSGEKFNDEDKYQRKRRLITYNAREFQKDVKIIQNFYFTRALRLGWAALI